MSIIPSHRILAVEIRACRFGYAVLETPKQLRDFGISWFDSIAIARLRIARWLSLSRPSVVVIRGASTRYRKKSRRRRAIVRIVRGEAKKRAISVVRISEDELNSIFENHQCRNKYDVARLVATWFPELAWRLPLRPKFYAAKPHGLLYFDTIALAIAYVDLVVDNGILSPASK